MNKQKMRDNVLITFILLFLFVILAILVKAHLVSNIDTVFYDEVTEHMSSILTSGMKIFTYIGDSIFIIIVCLSLIIINRLRWKYGVFISLGVILSSTLNMGLKIIFARERPDILHLINESNYSFPSGHAMVNATFYCLLGISVYKHVKNKVLKYVLIIVCILMPVIIGISRVYLGVHYMTDVIGGWIAGLFISFVIYFGLNFKKYNL